VRYSSACSKTLEKCLCSDIAFLLTNETNSLILTMKKYSIPEAAKLVGVSRASIYRWIERKLVPAPLAEVIAGTTVTYWTDKEIAVVRQYKASHYWGRGGRGKRRSQSN
jgi:predicted DNA-binding transcriptional regulator AlpA